MINLSNIFNFFKAFKEMPLLSYFLISTCLAHFKEKKEKFIHKKEEWGNPKS
jgi:hypothetical protein